MKLNYNKKNTKNNLTNDGHKLNKKDTQKKKKKERK